MPFEKPPEEQKPKEIETSQEDELSPEDKEIEEYVAIMYEDLQKYNELIDALRQTPSTPEAQAKIKELEELIELLQEQVELYEFGEILDDNN